MEVLSERYGWTPNQIMEQPQDIMMAYLEIVSMRKKLDKYHGKL